MTCVPVNSPAGGQATIDLIDYLGRSVQTIFSGNLPAGESKYFFQANGLPSGVYFVKLQSGYGIIAQKVLIE